MLATEQGQPIRARRIVIATGSTPILPPLLKVLAERLLTNEKIVELPTLPRHLAEAGLHTALRDPSRTLHMGSEVVPHCMDCGPGA